MKTFGRRLQRQGKGTREEMERVRGVTGWGRGEGGREREGDGQRINKVQMQTNTYADDLNRNSIVLLRSVAFFGVRGGGIEKFPFTTLIGLWLRFQGSDSFCFSMGRRIIKKEWAP